MAILRHSSFLPIHQLTYHVSFSGVKIGVKNLLFPPYLYSALKHYSKLISSYYIYYNLFSQLCQQIYIKFVTIYFLVIIVLYILKYIVHLKISTPLRNTKWCAFLRLLYVISLTAHSTNCSSPVAFKSHGNI